LLTVNAIIQFFIATDISSSLLAGYYVERRSPLIKNNPVLFYFLWILATAMPMD
jgi:hypothetical protein